MFNIFMTIIEYIFWFSLFLVFYTYIGYGILLYAMVRLKRFFTKPETINHIFELPEITLLIAAYNEQDYVEQKVANSLNLNYPKDKIKHIWVTDGSDDNTPNLLENYAEIKVLHTPERKGKIDAIHRAMSYLNTPIVIFSDANTMLGKDSIMKIVEQFQNERVGCVSGEKRVGSKESDIAAAAGEGLYWKYESTLKKWDYELYSVVGAAGELFAIRTELYEPLESDTLLDDFMISLKIAMKGYRIAYTPEAFALESASANVQEELKRKIRIAAGGIQSILRLLPLLNIFKYGVLSFQYISHRVLRWTITPFLLPIFLVVNIFLLNSNLLYDIFLLLQLVFYIFAIIGWMLENRKLKVKAFFVPFYFCVMNYSVIRGIFRYISKNQSVNWERAKRA